MTDLVLAPRGEGMRPYSPPERSDDGGLWLDANEGPAPDGSVLDALRTVTTEELTRYPDARPLERRIASRFGVDPIRVVVTNGGDDAIDRVCASTLTNGDEMLSHSPTFVMIERSTRLAGARVFRLPWSDGPFPVSGFLESISDRTKLISIVSPNNPTGLVVSLDDITLIARAAAARGIVVMVDLAYVEFADIDPTGALLDEPNVVVIRTYSKAMGLAGLRVGYAITPPMLADRMRAVGSPYPVSSVSLAIARVSEDVRDSRSGVIKQVRANRAALTEALRDAGFKTSDSQANFVYVSGPRVGSITRAMDAAGIRVRVYENAVRITVPAQPEDMSRVLAATNTIRVGSQPTGGNQ